jgi:3D (Asp-Asp-Asp) domain-containing protein
VSGRHILSRRSHRRCSPGWMGILAAIILIIMSLLLRPAQAYPDRIVDSTKMIASRQTAPERILTMTVTAYASSDADCGKHDGITATGSKAGPGTVASDWHVLRPGTRLEIPGYGPGIVADRGGGIRGDRLDVWMHDRAAARRWGRRKVKVQVLN